MRPAVSSNHLRSYRGRRCCTTSSTVTRFGIDLEVHLRARHLRRRDRFKSLSQELREPGALESLALPAELPSGAREQPPQSPPGRKPPAHRHSCDGQHIQIPAPHLTSDSQVKGGDDMVADWIVIYAVLFVLAAAVVGRVPADT
jgi:hypothetical protein